MPLNTRFVLNLPPTKHTMTMRSLQSHESRLGRPVTSVSKFWAIPLWPLFLILIIGLGLTGGLRADTVTPLDAATGTEQEGSHPQSFIKMGTEMYFTATPTSNPAGVSLYKTNGSTTTKIADFPDWVHSVGVAGGSTLYIIVQNGGDVELWKSDGTTASLVKNLGPANAGELTGPLLGSTTPNSQRVYFNHWDATNGWEIWTSDGTTGGTNMIDDLNPGTADTFVSPGVVRGDILFFAHDGGDGLEPWKTDGTALGTIQLADLNVNPSEGSNPKNFILWNGDVYFSASDTGTADEDVWVTDGNTTDFFSGDGTDDFFAGDVRVMCPVGNTLYLIAQGSPSSSTLYSLWSLDQTGTATEVKDLPDHTNFNSDMLWAAGARLFFTWATDTYADELWTSNGTTAGTVLVEQLHPGHSGSFISGVNTAIGNTTYFLAQSRDDYSVVGLFKSDGTPAGTLPVYTDSGDGDLGEAIFTFGQGSSVFGGNGGTIFFAGYDTTNGVELWKVNGAPAAMLSNLNTATSARSGAPWGITAFGTNSIILQMESTAAGSELWKSNGTLAGTTLLKDIRTGARGSFPQMNVGIALGTRFLFQANDGVNGREPWTTNGTTAGTALLKNLTPGIQGSNIYDVPVLFGGQAYFISDPTLYRTTGVAGNATEIVMPDNIPDGVNSSLAVAGSSIYFAGYVTGADPFTDPDFGQELVKTDGTTAGTVMVKDINPDPYTGSDPSQFTAVGSTLFFAADNGTNGYELWKSDGSEAGTQLVKDINPAGDGLNRFPFDDPANLTRINFGGLLYFIADNGTDGVELWKSNGTGAGTTMVEDINPAGDSSPQMFTIMGGFLYFVADDGTHGFELWRTDGTTTEMVKDVNPGPPGMDGGSGFYGKVFAVLNGLLYFAADNGTVGAELWSTNGTEAGTTLVADINPGADGSYPDELTASGTLLYFGAYNPAIGNELHVLSQGPEIVVNQGVGGTSLTDGSAAPVNFGNVPINTNTPITFEIVNTGTADLTDLAVMKSGTHMANYTVGALSATTVAPGATATFTVTLNTPVVGTRTAALSIASNDGDENPFNINLTANGVATGGTLAFGGTSFQVNETDGSINIPITRTGGTGTVDVTVKTANGTATVAGGDYTAFNSPVSITEGNNGQATIAINNLGGDEPNETFTVTLSAPTNGAVLGTPVTATVRIIDSVDNTPPSAPSISSPLAGASVGVNTGATLNIAGTATDNKGVQFVEYRVVTPGGMPSAFTAANLSAPGAASTGWTGVITPVAGNNTIEVRTRDFKSPTPNTSLAATRTFKITRPLLVGISGTGTVTPAGYAPSSFREVGKPHTITATAGTGALFAGWTVLSGHTNTQLGTNSTALGKATLNFVHREGLELRANFVTNPYTTNVVGTFNGAIRPSTTLPDVAPAGPGAEDGTASGLSTEGYISMLVQTTGGFSGSMKIDGLTLGVAGAFDHSGVARFGTSRSNTLSVARAEKPSLAVSLNINTGTGKITGNIWQLEAGTIVAVSDVEADRAFYSATNPVPATAFNATVGRPAAGTYTMLFEPGDGGALGTSQFPQGYGHGTVTVSTAGAVTVAGKLADSTPIGMSTTLSQAGTWRLFVQLYTGMQGFIAGNVTTDHSQTEGDFEAPDTRWVCPIVDRQHYPLGWAEGITVDTYGSKLTVTTGTSVVPLNQATGTGDGNADLRFQHGQLAGTVQRRVDISPGDVVTEVPVDATYNLGISRTTGGFSGSFTHDDGTKPTFSGVVFQKTGSGLFGARGFFLTTTPTVKTYTGESGEALLQAQP